MSDPAIEYRSPASRGRWESSPFDEATSLALFGANYDLRIDGLVRPADRAHERPADVGEES